MIGSTVQGLERYRICMDIDGQLTVYTESIALPFNLRLRTWVVMRMLKVQFTKCDCFYIQMCNTWGD